MLFCTVHFGVFTNTLTNGRTDGLTDEKTHIRISIKKAKSGSNAGPHLNVRVITFAKLSHYHRQSHRRQPRYLLSANNSYVYI